MEIDKMLSNDTIIDRQTDKDSLYINSPQQSRTS